ncbi:carbohydrate binding domain-containing protein [Clostridium omnivorum]|uniref:Uncharacterized protein n=1 Tax=Clostridium omnivorum TaxID=1604902 RepID=A0ABQ5N372_9CLOT|nr:carbohydrate binding domain-containing protein [Clostridium sp. E14]GLC29653.1 hypothetical protein bsdE14_10630 [Clostridium sp. E14]
MKKEYKVISVILSVLMLITAIPSRVLAENVTSNSNKSTESAAKVNGGQDQEDKSKEVKILEEVEDKREENVKHFLKEDMTYEAVVYPEAVHYQEDGKLKDIDNTLEEKDDVNLKVQDKISDIRQSDESEGNMYKELLRNKKNLSNWVDSDKNIIENKNNEFKTKIAKNANSNKLVSLKKDNYEIYWGLRDANNSKAKVQEITEEDINKQADKEAQDKIENDSKFKNKSAEEKNSIKDTIANNEKKKALQKYSSTVTFKEALNNVDLQYILTGKKVKENIIINKQIDKPEFKFDLGTVDLEAKLENESTVLFYDKKDSKKVLFTMTAPYMIDANKKTSGSIKLNLVKDPAGYVLSVIPDKEWLNDKERKYPVTIDPPVITPVGSNQIKDTVVSDKYPDTNYYTNQLLRTGYSSSYGNNITYIKFNLPNIKSSDVVTGAYLNLSLQNDSGIDNQVNVHKVKEDWISENITWRYRSLIDERIEDYQIVHGAFLKNYTWNITNIAKDWYSSGFNYGLALKNQGNAGYCEFTASDNTSYVGGYLPYAQINYTSNAGLESYWIYHSQSAGRAGTGYINDYSGNLVFTHDDYSMSGSRLPMNIKHVFNSNEKHTQIGYGSGWRLNYYQRVNEVPMNGEMYYTYIDEDGTMHYFKNNSGVYKDESGLDLTMAKNSDGTYTVKDNKDNKLHFRSDGLLIDIQDKNGNMMILGYDGTTLRTIKDGAGRVTNLFVDANKRLKTIVDPSQRTVATYNYDGERLTEIVYADGNKTVYSYDADDKLLSAENYDGYRLEYQYYNPVPYRVSKVIEKHKDGTMGGEYSISYSNNSTTYVDEADPNKKSNTYYFNDMGNTISVKDNLGNAKYYKYYNKNDANGGVNKLQLESKLQKTVVNYLKNHNAELDSDWISDYWTGSTGSSSYATEENYSGIRSLKVVKTNTTERQFFSQELKLEKGKTYTLSGYVKAKGISNASNAGATIFVLYKDGAGNWQNANTQFVTGDTEWQRYEMSFTIPSNATDNTVYFRPGIVGATGTAYFDCLQLEDGDLANRYNLVENADFKYGSDTPSYWSKVVNSDSSDTLTQSDVAIGASNLDLNAFKLTGAINKDKELQQRINVSGKKGDVLTVGAWIKANSVPLDGDRRCEYAIAVGGSQWKILRPSYYSTQWQYVSDVIVADTDYSYISVYLVYKNNVGTAYFDGVQIYKEEFGTSYQYDSKGNVVSTVDLSSQQSKYEYSTNNDLVKATDPKGNNFTYEYDGKHNITKSTSAENVVCSFEYDSYGNPKKSKIGDATLFVESNAAYTDSGNYMKSLTDSLGNTVKYDYDETKGLLNSVTDAKSNVTSYKYDPNLDRLNSVSKSVDGQTITNSYGYEKDRIKTITHNGFSYNFGYDSLGNNTAVAVGNQNLINNSYEPRTGKLLSSTYGNSQKVENIYDVLDRVISKKVDGVEKFKYKYDANGNLGYHSDLVNNINYRYIYDSADRLTKSQDSNGNTIGYEYDKNNNLSKLTDKINNNTYSTIYSYDKDNKPNITTINGGQTVSYGYDAIARLKSKIISTGAASVSTTYDYLPGVNGSATTKVSEVNNNGSKINYTYDKNGNIDTITQNGKKIKYYYNEANEAIREDNESLNKTFKYVYDAGGNILSKSEYAYTTAPMITDGILEQPRSELFGDGSFEQGTRYGVGRVGSGATKVTGPGFGGPNNPRTGNLCFFMDGGAGDNYAYMNAVTPVVPGKTYNISFYHMEATAGKFNDHSSYARLSNGSYLGLNMSLVGDQVWRPHVQTWTCPQGVNSIQLRFGFNVTAYSWLAIDDIRIEETSANNLLIDGGFEANLRDIEGRVGIGATRITGPGFAGDNNPRTGSRCFFMDGGAGDNYAYLNAVTPVVPGKTYDISFYHREATSGKFNGHSSYVRLSNGSYLGLNMTFAENPVWTKYTQTWTCPDGVNSIQLRFGFNATAYSWLAVDDIRIVESGTKIETNNPLKIYNYTYGDSNWKDKLKSYDNKSIDYDNIGNPISYDGYTYAWEQGRQLKSISGNGKTLGFKYNDAGIRTEKSYNGTVTKYHLIGDKVTYEDNGTDKIYYTYDSSAHLVSMNLNGVEYYYIRNAQGDIIGLFDKNGTQVVSYTYDTWGKLISIDGSLKDSVGVKNPYRYRGYRYDTETGLYYIQSRYYNPEWGRFINADAVAGKIGELLSHNVFAYCCNNPISREDPDGFSWRDQTEGGGGGLGGLIALGAMTMAEKSQPEIESSVERTVSRRDIIQKAVNATQKIVRNPYGKKGSPAHQEAISKVQSLLEKYDCKVQREFYVPIENGLKRSRYGDLLITEPNGEKWIVQVGKQTLSGKPVPRERDAIMDLLKSGYQSIFVPYN